MKQCTNSFTIFLAALAVVVVVVAVLGAELPGAEAVTCSPVQMMPCVGAISSPTEPPSKECCAKLTEQQPCLCGYIKNPFYKGYVESPNAKRMAVICGVPAPKCP